MIRKVSTEVGLSVQPSDSQIGPGFSILTIPTHSSSDIVVT